MSDKFDEATEKINNLYTEHRRTGFLLSEITDILRDQFAVKVSEDAIKIATQFYYNHVDSYSDVLRDKCINEIAREITSFVQSREKAAVIEKLEKINESALEEGTTLGSLMEYVCSMLSELKGGA